MVVEDADLLDDTDGGVSGGKGSALSCSICLDAVTHNGSRSRAKLQCGHEFHLDCIGSAFNVKGAMQCPNCRKIEKGQWLYANGGRSLPEFNMDDWAHEEDLYDLSYSEMSFGVRWCPFSGLTRLPSSLDEGEFAPSAYHELIGQQALFTENTTAIPSSTNPCPYIAYIGPVHPSSSNSNPSVSSENFNSIWNTHTNHQSTSQAEIQPASYGFPPIDYHSWDHPHQLSPTFPVTSSRISGSTTDQPPVMTPRASRPSDIQRPRSYVHPFIIAHSSSNARIGSSVMSSMVPPYPSSAARSRGRVQALQAYFQQPTTSPPQSVHRARPNPNPNPNPAPAHRGLAQAAPLPQSDQPSGFYFFPSPSRTFPEATDSGAQQTRFHIREPGLAGQVDPVWGPIHQPAGYRPRQSHNRS